MADNDMFNDLSSDSGKANEDQEMQNDFEFGNEIQGNYGNEQYDEGQDPNLYFDNNAYGNQQNPDEQIEQAPQFMFQNSNMDFQNRQQSYIQQVEQPNAEIKMESQMEEEQMINVEIKQQNELVELNYDHLNRQDDEGEKDQPIKSQVDMKPVEDNQYSFIQMEFNDIFQAAASINQLSCFPPPYFKNFNTPKSMAPPSLDVIQKNKQYFCLGNKIDVKFKGDKNSIAKYILNLINSLLTQIKNQASQYLMMIEQC